MQPRTSHLCLAGFSRILRGRIQSSHPEGSIDLSVGLAIRRLHHQHRQRNMMRILVILLSPLLLLSTLLVTMAVSSESASSDPSANIVEQQALVGPEEACSDFNTGMEYYGSPWMLNDCIQVWTDFVDTVPSELNCRPWGIDLWRSAALRLRLDGSPCLVASTPSPGGAGSYMIHQLGAWIFAEQMGCDLVSPDWRSKQLAPGEDTAALYCHTVATTRETEQALLRRKANDIRHCAMISWPEYFQLDIPSVKLPEHGTFRIIEVSMEHGGDFQMGLREHIEYAGVSALGSDRVIFTIDATSASQHLLAIGSWDETKRQTVRAVLEEARTNFHWHPRRWYSKKGSCGFDLQRLNFAVHVRTGDRRDFQEIDEDYFERLEQFMIAVTETVSTKGLLPPVFHVFSETLSPCPSEQTQIFDEFPTWPVHSAQISCCLEAETPDDCPEKRAGARLCNADRPGMFFVHNKPIVLHVGRNVGEAMSCMIQSDGVMMGCSTFGQVAGLLTKGIRFFSTQCDGENTPEKHKAISPLAIAERGLLWVPISGSWRDPILVSTEILSGALETILRNMHNA